MTSCIFNLLKTAEWKSKQEMKNTMELLLNLESVLEKNSFLSKEYKSIKSIQVNL
jgi:hypothetical protein